MTPGGRVILGLVGLAFALSLFLLVLTLGLALAQDGYAWVNFVLSAITAGINISLFSMVLADYRRGRL